MRIHGKIECRTVPFHPSYGKWQKGEITMSAFLGSLLPRMQSAQNRDKDVTRKTDLSQIQTAIITAQTYNWIWPGMDAAKNWIAVSDIETELMNVGISSVPKDPSSSNKVYWLGTAQARWDYLYMVTMRNSIPNGWFILMAKTDSEAWSNWVVCENKLWLKIWYIESDTDLKNVKPCDVLSKWSSCSNSDWFCTYTSTDQLRYILMY